MGVEETAKLIVEAQAKGFADVEAKIKLTQGSLDALTASYDAGSIGLTDYLRYGTELRSELERLTAAHARATAMNAAAAAAAAAAQPQVFELADAYDVLGDEMGSVFTTAQQVGLGMAADAAAMREAAVASAAMTSKWTHMSTNIREYGVVAGKAKTGQSQLTQQITAGSYAFQDFAATSGDLGAKLNSVTNNIPQLLVGLGGIGIGLSVAATAGVAAYRNWNDIAGLWETRNPFPKAAHDIAGLKIELDAAKDATKKLEEAGTGNAAQLAKYNDLRTKTAEIEQKISQEEERQARMKKFKEDTSIEKEAKDRAGRFESTLAKPEQREELARSVEEALPRERLDKLKEEKDRTEKERVAASENFNPFDPRSTIAFARATGAAKKAQAAYEAQLRARTAEADDIASKAVVEGNADATERIKQLQKQKPDKFSDYQRFAIEDSDPAKAREEQQHIEQQKHDAALDKALKAKRVALAEKDVADAQEDLKHDPEHLADVARQKRAGEMDERGRTRFQAGFNEDSARRVQMEAARQEREKAQKAAVLPPLENDATERKFADRQRTEAVEQYAAKIHGNSQFLTGGVQFTPNQARQVSARAYKAFDDLSRVTDAATAEAEALRQAVAEQLQGIGATVGRARGGNGGPATRPVGGKRGGPQPRGGGMRSVPPSAGPNLAPVVERGLAAQEQTQQTAMNGAQAIARLTARVARVEARNAQLARVTTQVANNVSPMQHSALNVRGV